MFSNQASAKDGYVHHHTKALQRTQKKNGTDISPPAKCRICTDYVQSTSEQRVMRQSHDQEALGQ